LVCFIGEHKNIKTFGTFLIPKGFIIVDMRKESLECSSSNHRIPALFIPTILIRFYSVDGRRSFQLTVDGLALYEKNWNKHYWVF